ncbi:hypothetical protein SAMN02910298_01043 [Pseudobutyrivibrio sp. YE44]|uniref:hypothetical protein n=1 Tax=Pseudobutyrivibrio sp. YE44 TaxID=1520802 RepID=UPI0008914A05|nr:hypothetical protein [Pseudobutyrivibrio sp. YE44]SDB21756.1 hypothetical protein SAMN02910298_01043 [Pseudobutyrivibrio sp. YE44]
MNTANMLINVAAILAGLVIYILISNTKWGKAHQDYQYAIMLMAMMAAVLIGGLVRWLIV